MIRRFFSTLFAKGFAFNFFLSFCLGLQFARLTRPERDVHGSSFWNWDVTNFDYSRAAVGLLITGIVVAIWLTIEALRRRKRFEPKSHLS